MGRGFVAALIAGAAYMVVVLGYWSGPGAVLLKGAGVALLAFWAAMQARSTDGWLIAAVMALGATGDVLLELARMVPGAAAFLGGHIVAVVLYRRNGAGWVLIACASVAVAAAARLVAHDMGVALYALGLGAMAGAATASRFPRRFVALGAWLFVVSDLLIFARMGLLADSILPHLLIWPTYFGGQALIAWGVVTTLARRRNDHGLHDRL